MLGAQRTRRAPVRAIAIALHLATCAGVTFKLEPSHERCISETIPVRSLLTGDWRSSGEQTSTQVRAPSGNVLFEKKDPAGHFSVTATVAGEHHICVRNEGTSVHEVSLNVKQAVEVDDHNMVAKQEHVEAIEAELDRMKKMATHVYEEMVYMRDRGDAMHITSEQTRARLLWVEVSMMCVLLFMGLWQIHYLKRYFQTKKII